MDSKKTESKGFPAEWALKKALTGLFWSIDDVAEYPETTSSKLVVRLAELIEKYEDPPIDPILKAAREFCSRRPNFRPSDSEKYLDGTYDDTPSVNIAKGAIAYFISLGDK